MPDYKTKQGDCIESIAFRHGLFWETIWDHPKNQQVRMVRKDPNVLLAGDNVFVPEKKPKEEPGATEQRHRFKRKGVPSKLEMIFKDQDQPRVNLPYVLAIDGQLFSGKTDGQGRIRHPIPPNAQRGRLTLGAGEEREEYDLQLGHLDPVAEISGVQQRLNELGFSCGNIDGVLGPRTHNAIRDFQAKHGLNETGELDDPTRERLVQEHGS
jgi:N-acetylmuramoyl-L-alanine amidase